MLKAAVKVQLVSLFIILVLAPSISNATEKFDENDALRAFKARTFIKGDNAVNMANAIDDVVGVYVTKTDGEIKLQGNRANEKDSAKKFDLKDSIVYQELYSSSVEVGLKIVEILNLGGSKKELDELVISDIVSVSDPTVTLDACVKKRPVAFSDDTKYWCVSGITLSKISTNKYKKTNKLVSGSYGVATANGTFQQDATKTSATVVANVSLIGPIMKDKLVPEVETAHLTPSSTLGVKSKPPYMPKELVSKDKGLAGVILQFRREK